MDNKTYDLDMILKYLHTLQGDVNPAGEEFSDEEVDDSADSVISTASKKRVRLNGSKNVGGKRIKSLKLDANNSTINFSILI